MSICVCVYFYFLKNYIHSNDECVLKGVIGDVHAIVKPQIIKILKKKAASITSEGNSISL